MSRHDAYAPLNVPKPFGDHLWIVDGPAIGFGWLGLELPFPTRMTVVQLPDGGLWLHSPVAWHEGLAARLADIGPVRHLVAPNTLHYWYLPDWARRFPQAQVHLAPGLPAKAKRVLPEGAVMGSEPDAAWAGTIDQVAVCGDVLNEVAFFHRPSATLILCDLIENFEPQRLHPWWLRKAIKLSGAAHPHGRAPIDLRLTFWRHRRAVRRAVRRMIDWEPQRIVLSHGRCHAENGSEELRRAFRWVL